MINIFSIGIIFSICFQFPKENLIIF